jgi:hypothetical protein
MLNPIPAPDVRRCLDALADLEPKLGHGPAVLITAQQNDWDMICKEMSAFQYDLRRFTARAEPIQALRQYLDTCKARRGKIESWRGFDFFQSHDGKGFGDKTRQREIERLASDAVLYRREEVERILAEVSSTERSVSKEARTTAIDERRDAMIECAKKLWTKPGRNGRFLTKNEICQHAAMLQVATLKNRKTLTPKSIWKVIKHLNPDTRPGVRPKI